MTRPPRGEGGGAICWMAFALLVLIVLANLWNSTWLSVMIAGR